MSDAGASAIATSIAGAAQSLRDTAKWLVGGVVSTAAGVFAGSSLTALGALDPQRDHHRLVLVATGAAVGFIALAVIFAFALRVLGRASFTMRELASAGRCTELAKVRSKLLTRYRHRLPADVADFQTYVTRLDAAVDRGAAATDADRAELAAATVNADIIGADAGFMVVKRRYNALLVALFPATLLAAAGFGLFAWAANPPKSTSPPPAFSLTIQGGAR